MAPELTKEDEEKLQQELEEEMDKQMGEDPYHSQLEKSKAVKVASAQSLVEKASKDPKIIKQNFEE